MYASMVAKNAKRTRRSCAGTRISVKERLACRKDGTSLRNFGPQPISYTMGCPIVRHSVQADQNPRSTLPTNRAETTNRLPSTPQDKILDAPASSHAVITNNDHEPPAIYTNKHCTTHRPRSFGAHSRGDRYFAPVYLDQKGITLALRRSDVSTDMKHADRIAVDRPIWRHHRSSEPVSRGDPGAPSSRFPLPSGLGLSPVLRTIGRFKVDPASLSDTPWSPTKCNKTSG